MTYSSRPAKLLIVADPRPMVATKHDPVSSRRYRPARLRFEGRSQEPGRRFAHLTRVFD
jgi:hypothetical protein